MNNSKCPVPKEQQPTNEFLELSNSIIFASAKTNKKFSVLLISTWFVAFLIFLVISSGSSYFSNYLLKYIFLSFFGSLLVPFLITIRLLLGWSYIYKRLTSEIIEYEESGWYDFQTWSKPIALLEKETLIASIEVKPILKNLTQITSIIISLILIGILIFQYYKI